MDRPSIRPSIDLLPHSLYVGLLMQEERIGFDSQLAALERTSDAKQRDYEELLLLSGDANHARDVAQGELERVSPPFSHCFSLSLFSEEPAKLYGGGWMDSSGFCWSG